MPKQEYLTKDEFEKFKTNDFAHLDMKCDAMVDRMIGLWGKIKRMEGIQYLAIGLLIALLTWALTTG